MERRKHHTVTTERLDQIGSRQSAPPKSKKMSTGSCGAVDGWLVTLDWAAILEHFRFKLRPTHARNKKKKNANADAKQPARVECGVSKGTESRNWQHANQSPQQRETRTKSQIIRSSSLPCCLCRKQVHDAIQVLLHKTGNVPYPQRSWGFPGGSMNKPEDAAVRRIRDRERLLLGVTVRVGVMRAWSEADPEERKEKKKKQGSKIDAKSARQRSSNSTTSRITQARREVCSTNDTRTHNERFLNSETRLDRTEFFSTSSLAFFPVWSFTEYTTILSRLAGKLVGRCSERARARVSSRTDPRYENELRTETRTCALCYQRDSLQISTIHTQDESQVSLN